MPWLFDPVLYRPRTEASLPADKVGFLMNLMSDGILDLMIIASNTDHSERFFI